MIMLLKRINAYKKLIGTAMKKIAPMKEIIAAEHFENLKKNHQDPKSLIPYGYKVFSQNEEDGKYSAFHKPNDE